MLSAKVLWPLFPLLLLVVVVCLTWALVYVVRHPRGPRAIWLQSGALVCYLVAATTAVASERGAVSSNLHRPFSLLTQVLLLVALLHFWRQKDRQALLLNIGAWGAILADTALHYLLAR